MVKYRVTLTEQERAGLKKMVSAGKGAARKLLHARILLLTDVGERGRCCSDDEITDALEVSRSTSYRVRERSDRPGFSPDSVYSGDARRGRRNQK